MRALWAYFWVSSCPWPSPAGVATAAPGQSEWDSGVWNVTNGCTGEQIVGTFESTSSSTEIGPSHFNVHLVGVGQTTGARYEGQTESNWVLPCPT